MAQSPTRRRDLLRRSQVVARWPVGMGLAGWRYLWRTTPVHRHEHSGPVAAVMPVLPSHLDDDAIQHQNDGVGPLFRRRYRAWICGTRRTPADVVARVAEDPNRVAPREVAVFRKTAGARRTMVVGDEYVIRMPGPWDGPVRVVDRTDTSFRFATLRGHLEAGQIEFRLSEDAQHLFFEIESWARSGDRLSYVLYDRVRMAKEMQLHMWTHFIERVARLAGGRMAGGIEVSTERCDEHATEGGP